MAEVPDRFLQHVLRGEPVTSSPVIDAHAHVLNTTESGVRFSHADAAGMVTALDRLGIDRACVSVVGSGHENDEMLAVLDAAPGRFVGFVSVNPRYPGQMLDDLHRCFEHPMVMGIGEVHPTSYQHEYPITGDRYVPVWEFANARRIPVLIHSGPRSEAARCSPAMLAEVARAFPDMPVLVGHAGGYDSWDMLDQAIEATAGCNNMFLELCAMGRFYGAVEHMVDGLGAGKVVFGTDGPFHDWTAEVAHVACARLSDDEKRQIFGGTMQRLLDAVRR